MIQVKSQDKTNVSQKSRQSSFSMTYIYRINKLYNKLVFFISINSFAITSASNMYFCMYLYLYAYMIYTLVCFTRMYIKQIRKSKNQYTHAKVNTSLSMRSLYKYILTYKLHTLICTDIKSIILQST